MIIQSLLDNDLYKFTMMQVVFHHFSDASVEYTFQCRTPHIDFAPLAEQFKSAILALCNLTLSSDEMAYLAQLPYIKKDFVTFLQDFRLNADDVHIETKPHFSLRIKGPWLHTILFEVPLLAIVNEVYFTHHAPNLSFDEGEKRLAEKIDLMQTTPAAKGLQFSDFGTRRRFSFLWQDHVVGKLKAALPHHFTGTSNIHLARKYNITPIGTMAHEYIQAFQVLAPNLKDSQRVAFETWAKEYGDRLSIALSDTYGTDPFLRDFNQDLATIYQGARQDSGDPIQWGEKLIQHYEALGIDPKTKTFVFSDSLTFPKMIEIYTHFAGRTHPVFGIGTNLMNDMGPKPLDIVIKMTHCNNKPVAKISDAPGKIVCEDPHYLTHLKKVFEIN